MSSLRAAAARGFDAVYVVTETNTSPKLPPRSARA
jgi:hypothetical protein